MIEKRFSVRIEDRTAELIIMGVPTSVVLERVPLTTESIEKLETLLAVSKQVLTGNVKKERG